MIFDFLIPLALADFLKLPMILHASSLFLINGLSHICMTISTEECLDFLKAGPDDKCFVISDNNLEDKDKELMRKLLKVILSEKYL